MPVSMMICRFLLSPSSRRAWIEIRGSFFCPLVAGVALLAEGVDRNIPMLESGVHNTNVALLAEGVDRNSRRDCGTT